jgi:hypothetical protein
MKEKCKKLFCQKISTGNKNYTFSVEETKEGINYLVITSSLENKIKDKEENRITVALSHLEDFENGLNKAINFFIEKGESKIQRIKRIRQKYKRVYVKWTKEEDLRLKNGYLKGKTIEQLAEMLHREPAAIRSRLRKLKMLFYS